MTLTVNGQPRQTSVSTVRDLLRELALDKPGVAVEVNKKLVPRREHDRATLKDGDVVEVVTLVGGG